MPERSQTLSPGPDLDAIVAERVMGWRRRGAAWDTPAGLRTIEPTSFGSFQPSTDIAAAWEVVEKMRGRFKEVRLFFLYGKWSCAAGDRRESVESTTAPLAICLAALDACEAGAR